LDSVQDLIKIARYVGLVAIDVGARGGPKHDLDAIAPAVDFYCFEPDEEECTRLNQQGRRGPWKSVTYLPTALAAEQRQFELNLYRKRGCSSGLRARQEVGEIFCRGDYYIHDGVVSMEARRFDDVAAEFLIEKPAFMKIDVQGMEVEVFRGAAEALKNDLVGIRTEVSFFPLYDEQPLFADVDQCLRSFDFYPMRWIETHEWRRLTRTKYPGLSEQVLPASRGQLMHADVLYLAHPEALPHQSEEHLRRLIRLGLVAICYGHIDHADAAFRRPGVSDYIQEKVGVNCLSVLQDASNALARSARLQERVRKLGRFMARLSGMSID
jgi:FkbM family methyltransferase